MGYLYGYSLSDFFLFFPTKRFAKFGWQKRTFCGKKGKSGQPNSPQVRQTIVSILLGLLGVFNSEKDGEFAKEKIHPAGPSTRSVIIFWKK